MTILISPTERWDHAASFPGSVVSSVPEQYGADILIVTRHGKLGIQQKVFPDDFFASLGDGRLAKEVLQMKSLDIAVLLLQGVAMYTSEGYLVDVTRSRWTETSLRNFQRSLFVQHQVYTEWVGSEGQAVVAIREWARYMDKEHKGLARPKPETNSWGKVGSRDWGIHMLQGFPGVGPKRAAAIYDKFGKAPLRWECTVEEIMEVDGVGKKMGERLMAALRDGDTGEPEC